MSYSSSKGTLSQLAKRSRPAGLFIAVLLALSSVYWLPGVAPKYLAAIKDVLTSIVVIFSLVPSTLSRGKMPTYIVHCTAAILPAVLIGIMQGGGAAVVDGLRLLLGPLLSWAVYLAWDPIEARRLLKVILFPAVLSSAYVVAAAYGTIHSFEPPQSYAYWAPYQIGFSSGTSALSDSVAYLGPVAIYMVITAKGIRRVMWALAALAMGLALVISGGRAGSAVFVGTASVFVIGTFLRRFGSRLTVGIFHVTVGVATMAGVAAIALSFPQVLAGRDIIYEESVRMIKEAPITGHGWGVPVVGNLFAHNWVLQAGVSAGLIGAVAALLSLVLLISFILIGIAQSQENTLSYAIGVGLLGSVLISQVETIYPFGPFYVVAGWWALLGILARLARFTAHPYEG